MYASSGPHSLSRFHFVSIFNYIGNVAIVESGNQVKLNLTFILEEQIWLSQDAVMTQTDKREIDQK